MADTESKLRITEGSGAYLRTIKDTIGGFEVHAELIKLGEPYLTSGTVVTPVAGTSTATTSSHVLQVMAPSSLRLRIRRIEIHQAVLATTAQYWQVGLYRLSTAGTGGSSVTPNPLDPADSMTATAMTLPTVKGTEGALLAYASPYLMQTAGASATQAQPICAWDFDRPRSKSLVVASGTANGIAVKAINGVAGASVIVAVWLDEVT